MWKESYQLGIEKIDAQHKKLFEAVWELLREIEGENRPEIYKQIIQFLNEYVVVHFRDEEEYFKSTGYADQEGHKKQHMELTKQVEKYAVQLEEAEYDLSVVKKFAGMLSAWLVYHVVGEDLKYVEGTQQESVHKQSSYIEYFTNSMIQVLETMAGVPSENIQKETIYDDLSVGDIFIEIELVGDLKGRVVFGFTKEFALQLVEAMMSFAPPEVDELVCSALSEVSNIASGNGTIAISSESIACDICPPRILQNGLSICRTDGKMKIDTPIGTVTIAVYLD